MLLLTYANSGQLALPPPTVTHEQYVQAIYQAVLARARPDVRPKLEAIKLTYGAGPDGVRGVTYFSRWRNGHDDAYPFVAICATSQEGWLQVCGTVVHELAHVLAGCNAGHGPDWKNAGYALGLRNFQAAGTEYLPETFEPDLLAALEALPRPTDGAPVNTLTGAYGQQITLKPCGAGYGTRGGKSRGVGSGTRNLKVTCAACGYTARVARRWLDVGAPHCGAGHGPMREPDEAGPRGGLKPRGCHWGKGEAPLRAPLPSQQGLND